MKRWPWSLVRRQPSTPVKRPHDLLDGPPSKSARKEPLLSNSSPASPADLGKRLSALFNNEADETSKENLCGSSPASPADLEKVSSVLANKESGETSEENLRGSSPASPADLEKVSSVLANKESGEASEENPCGSSGRALAVRPENVMLTLAKAEQERRDLFGGWPLRETIDCLGSVVGQVTPAFLQRLHKALESDFTSCGGTLPALPSNHVAREPSDDIPLCGAPLGGGDTFACKIGKNEVRVRLLKEGALLSARVFFLIAGNWKGFSAAVHLQRDSASSKKPQWRIRFEIVSDVHNLPLDLPSLEGHLSEATVSIDGNNFDISRSRAHLVPASKWREAIDRIDVEWSSCEFSLERLRKAKEFKASIQQFNVWRQDLDAMDVQLSAAKKEERFVLFVGSSGVGKSKLINQLLGEDVLPSDGAGSAVTAAPILLHFQAIRDDLHDAAPGSMALYHVEFELFTQEEFEGMRTQMIGRLVEYWELTERDSIPATKPPVQDDARAARHAHDWLEAVYGARAFPKEHEWCDKEELCEAFGELPKRMQKRSPSNFRIKTAAELEAKLRQWLVADEEHRMQAQTWPLVKLARVRGPWQLLASGIVFVDLPGIGDSNAVRNGIAAREWKRADFACICSTIHRAVTDKESMEWLDKAVRDLPAESIAYVCTKADDISREEVIRKKGRKTQQPDTKVEVARERNERVKKAVRVRHHIPIYTVSARDYGRCAGLDTSAPETFDKAEDTEVPRLSIDICNAVLARRARQRVLFFESLVAKQKVMVSQLTECPEADFDTEKMKTHFDTLVKDLDSKLKTCCTASLKKLSRHRRNVADSAKAGAAESKRCLGSQAAHYGRATTLHWRRHKKLIDENGEWLDMDIPQDISHPMLESTDPHWATAFEAMPEIAEELSQQLLAKCSELMSEFAAKFAQWPNVQKHITTIGEAQGEAVRTMLKQQTMHLEEFLAEKRKGYAEVVKAAVKSELAPKLWHAQAESGPGSFARRKESVSLHMPGMTLAAPVDVPGHRLDEVKSRFHQISREMAETSRVQFDECYRSFWEAQARNKWEAAAKQALQGIVQRELHALEEPLKRAHCALPE